MTDDSKYIRFDWAIKRILRDKANFGVLEGLMTVLIGEKITIVDILESESNQDSREDKYNRVDVKAKTAGGEIIIVEVQLARESNFIQRILFGSSKAVIEQIGIGQHYDVIKKVYSISVVYFDLGTGSDYAYHGRTTFQGMNDPTSVLQFRDGREEKFIADTMSCIVPPDKVFPEYFILRVNQFNEVAKTPIEEWMEYLKSGSIRSDTSVPGLQEAREKLNYMRMTEADRRAYEEYMVSLHAAKDVYETGMAESRARGLAEGLAEGRSQGLVEGRSQGLVEGRSQGLAEGRSQGLVEGRSQGLVEGRSQGLVEGLAEGRSQGRAEEKLEIARKLRKMGLSAENVAQATGLTKEEVEELQ